MIHFGSLLPGHCNHEMIPWAVGARNCESQMGPVRILIGMDAVPPCREGPVVETRAIQQDRDSQAPAIQVMTKRIEFGFAIVKKFFTMRTVRHWRRLLWEAGMIHLWMCSRPSWMAPWTSWPNGRCPSPWQNIGTTGSLMHFTTQNIPWFHIQDQGQERDIKQAQGQCEAGARQVPTTLPSCKLQVLILHSAPSAGGEQEEPPQPLHSLIQGHTRSELTPAPADRALVGRHSWEAHYKVMVTADQGNWSLLVCSRQQRDKTVLQSSTKMTTLSKYNWTCSWKI